MFPTYNSLAEVPEAFREHYVMKGGKAVAEVSPDHPLVVNNATLKTEKTAAEARAQAAETERDQAKTALASAKVVPHGHEAVPKADAELARAVKGAGIESAEAFTTLKTNHDNYKTTAEEAQRTAHAEAVAEGMGWDGKKTARLVTKVYDLSQVEVRDGEGGKKNVVARVKGTGDALVEKPFADVVSATPELSDLLPALTTSPETVRVPGGTSGKAGGGANELLADGLMKDWYGDNAKPAAAGK